MSYDNFKDPLGLLKRMLTSGNRAAYFTILREGFSLLFKPIDWMLQPLERRQLRKAKPSNFPIVLILGGSRSGTTLLYQTLTQYLPVSYFNNLSASFPKSPITISKWIYPLLRKRKGNFNNYYGSVSGFNGPNDGFPIWNRWFGADRNSAEGSDRTDLVDMRRFFRAWQEVFPKPFINKNNRNSLLVPWFEKSLDQVLYLEIRRDPAYVVQSLILSREAVQGSKYIGWGVKGRDSDPAQDPLVYVDDICRQVFEVERVLDKLQAQIPSERYYSISYEQFCADPLRIVREIARFMGQPEPSETELVGLHPFQNTNKKKVSDQEWERIQGSLDRLFQEQN